ncbi:uncharacterized protein LOC125086687 [Lutra lutra]|uniref:uncharacterized protein LOC125086687 n=1 Tax=Lutra lutra TaxID=9657 RepID=UPI001FD3C33F|nr:uncharacterized protein LOC125086687 [Lutra lutra]
MERLGVRKQESQSGGAWWGASGRWDSAELQGRIAAAAAAALCSFAAGPRQGGRTSEQRAPTSSPAWSPRPLRADSPSPTRQPLPYGAVGLSPRPVPCARRDRSPAPPAFSVGRAPRLQASRLRQLDPRAPGSTSCPFSKDLSLIFSQRPTKTVNFHSFNFVSSLYTQHGTGTHNPRSRVTCCLDSASQVPLNISLFDLLS